MDIRKRLAIFVVVLIAVDQLVKFWVKTNMMIGEDIWDLGFFKILFIENNGMAFGMEFGGEKWGKTILSLFRLAAVSGIGWYILKLIKEKAPIGVLFSFSLIFCGAIGNIIDSLFYGMIFNDSHYQIASLFPVEGGYSSFLHGKVVDMLYFPLIEGSFPSWLPIWGGEDFLFFRPIFNFADSYITIGVSILILFHRKFFSDQPKEKLNENIDN